MKKLILISLILLLGFSSVYAVEPFNLNGIEFGMTREEVKAVEPGKLIGERGFSWWYATQDAFGLKACVRYNFGDSYFDHQKLLEVDLFLCVPTDMDAQTKYNEIVEDLALKYKGLFDSYGTSQWYVIPCDFRFSVNIYLEDAKAISILETTRDYDYLTAKGFDLGERFIVINFTYDLVFGAQ